MAVSYKGLTIKFGGDTTELQGALKKVQSSARETQSDLKDINRALKLNPGNTVLLEQKVKALNKAYGETKTKLDAYKQAMGQLEAKKQSGEKLTEAEQRQYESLQRAILQCKNDLDSYGKQLKRAGDEAEASKTRLYQLGKAIENNKDKIAKTGESISKFGGVTGAAFAGMAGAAYAAFGKLEDGQAIAIKSAGAIGESAEEMRRSVSAVADRAPGDFEKIGHAVGDVNTHFQVTGDELDELSTHFLEFSRVTDTDVSAAVENVAMIMKGFRVSTSQTSNVLDMLTDISTATGVSVETLTGSLNTNGATFREMGLSVQDAAALLGNMEAAGVPADTMLTGLKKAATNCAQSGKNLGGEMRDLAAKMQDPATEAKATQDAIDLFGSKSALAFIDAAKSGRMNLDDLGKDLGDYAGKVDGLMDETMGSGEKMTEALKQVTTAGAEIGEQFVPFVEQAAGAIRDFAGFIKNLSPEQKEFAAHLIVGGAAFGGIAFGVGKVVSAIPGFADGIKTASSAFKAFNGVLKANPILAVVGLVAMIVTALVTFFTQTEEGRQMWSGFCEGMRQAWQGVCDFFGPAAEFFGGIWTSVTAGVEGFGSDLAQKWEGIESGASQAWEGVKGFITSNIDNAKNIGSSASSVFKDALTGDWSALASDSKRLFGNVDDAVTSNLQAAKDSGIPIVSDLAAGALDKWNWLKTDGVAAFGKLASGIGEKLDQAKSWANEKAQGIVDFWRSIPDNIIGFFSDIGSKISNAFGSIHFPSPHVEWGGFDIGNMHVPLPTVNWYKNGGYFDRASVIGIGEHGGEYALPENRITDLMAIAIDKVRGYEQRAVSVVVSVNATIKGGADAYGTGQQIGNGIASKLKQRGVPIAT